MPIAPTDLILVLLIVLVIVLLWRGPKNLPGLGTAFGQAVKGARDAMRDVTGDRDGENPAASSDVVAAVSSAPPAPATPAAPPAAPTASAPETTPPPSAGPSA
jgi:Sec-independent protein translocase protein TatA